MGFVYVASARVWLRRESRDALVVRTFCLNHIYWRPLPTGRGKVRYKSDLSVS